MRIVYDRLWTLLISKKISKTDLCNLTGISSRTIAKLSKNQSVNTDTLLQICSVLDCQLSDIAEVKQTDSTDTVYETYVNHGKKVFENEALELFELEFDGIRFAIYTTKEKATKKHIVHCYSFGSVVLERRIRIIYKGRDYYTVENGEFIDAEGGKPYLKSNDVLILDGNNLFDGRIID